MSRTEDIWYEYHMKLTAFIKSRVGEDVVSDLLQDVFVKIHTQIDSLKENTKLDSWVYQITRNTIIDYYRAKRPTEELPEWVRQSESDGGEIVRKELSLCLEPMVRELPDKYREAVLLSEIENKTQNEVAQIVNISLSGAKSRVQRGRSLLKIMIHECCKLELGKKGQLIDYIKKSNGSDCC